MKQALKSLVAAVALASFASTAQAGPEDDTLRVAIGSTGAIENFDPYFNTARNGIWVANMVWDQLIYRDPTTYEYKPLLATAWEWRGDTTLRLTIREGVKWHDGEPFTVDDVVFTLNWVADPANKVSTQRNVNWIKEAIRIDDRTVDVHTKAPFPVAVEYLSLPVVIFPKHYYSKVGPEGMAKKPIGTGPFRVVSVKTAEEYVFEKNPDYTWAEAKGRPQVGKVIMREIADVQTQVAELLGGGIDFTADIATDHVEQLARVPGLRSMQAGTMRTGYLGFDAAGKTGFEPTTKLEVRQAIAHAVNRESLVANLIRGDARVIHTPCYPTQVGCITDAAVQWEYNPDKAKALLAKAGYPDGFEIDLHTYRPADWAEAIMADLARVGIRARLTRMPYFALRDLQWDNGTKMFLMDWGSYSVNDASAITSHFFKLGRDDYAMDKEVAAWLDTADNSIDLQVRNEHYAKAIRRITEQVYWLPMFNHVRNYAFRDGLEFTAYEDEIPRFWLYGWKK